MPSQAASLSLPDNKPVRDERIASRAFKRAMRSARREQPQNKPSDLSPNDEDTSEQVPYANSPAGMDYAESIQRESEIPADDADTSTLDPKLMRIIKEAQSVSDFARDLQSYLLRNRKDIPVWEVLDLYKQLMALASEQEQHPSFVDLNVILIRVLPEAYVPIRKKALQLFRDQYEQSIHGERGDDEAGRGVPKSIKAVAAAATAAAGLVELDRATQEGSTRERGVSQTSGPATAGIMPASMGYTGGSGSELTPTAVSAEAFAASPAAATAPRAFSAAQPVHAAGVRSPMRSRTRSAAGGTGAGTARRVMSRAPTVPGRARLGGAQTGEPAQARDRSAPVLASSAASPHSSPVQGTAGGAVPVYSFPTASARRMQHERSAPVGAGEQSAGRGGSRQRSPRAGQKGGSTMTMAEDAPGADSSELEAIRQLGISPVQTAASGPLPNAEGFKSSAAPSRMFQPSSILPPNLLAHERSSYEPFDTGPAAGLDERSLLPGASDEEQFLGAEPAAAQQQPEQTDAAAADRFGGPLPEPYNFGAQPEQQDQGQAGDQDRARDLWRSKLADRMGRGVFDAEANKLKAFGSAAEKGKELEALLKQARNLKSISMLVGGAFALTLVGILWTFIQWNLQAIWTVFALPGYKFIGVPWWGVPLVFLMNVIVFIAVVFIALVAWVATRPKEALQTMCEISPDLIQLWLDEGIVASILGFAVKIACKVVT